MFQVEIVAEIIEEEVAAVVNIVAVVVVQVTVQAEIIAPIHTRKASFLIPRANYFCYNDKHSPSNVHSVLKIFSFLLLLLLPFLLLWFLSLSLCSSFRIDTCACVSVCVFLYITKQNTFKRNGNKLCGYHVFFFSTSVNM